MPALHPVTSRRRQRRAVAGDSIVEDTVICPLFTELCSVVWSSMTVIQHKHEDNLADNIHTYW